MYRQPEETVTKLMLQERPWMHVPLNKSEAGIAFTHTGEDGDFSLRANCWSSTNVIVVGWYVSYVCFRCYFAGLRRAQLRTQTQKHKRDVLCCGVELWLAGLLATLHAENTPSFSSFLALGKARTWAFFWLARCCWLSPGLAGSLFPEPEPAVALPDPVEPTAWAWRSRGCKACAAGSDMSTPLDSSLCFG